MAALTMMDRAREISTLPGFDVEGLWLTFYLAADPVKLGALAHVLSPMGAVNLDGGVGGFLYPKLPAANDPSAIVAGVEQVLEAASAAGVHVLSVDVDTTPDVGSSTFVELARFAPGGR